jgi:ankyrin repeat protein
MVQLLVDAGADPSHVRTSSGNSLLHVAVKKGVAIVQTLLGVNGVEVDVRRPDGLTPLWHLATYWPGPATEDNVLVMKALLDAGADPNIRMGESKRTLLHELVPRKIWYIAPLLDTKIDVNACMNIGGGVTVPLLAVAIKKSTRQAVDPGMLLMQRLMAGSTDFDTVPENEAIDVMRSLINKGADIHWNEHGATLLHLAAYLGLENMVAFIASHPKFDVNAKDGRGATALHLAVEQNSPECVRALVRAGTDVEVQMGSETPLFKAARNGSLEIVKILLTEADSMTSTICGTYGDTALTIAARCLQKEVVAYLCQRRISLMGSSDLGRSEVLDQEDVLLEAFAETFPPQVNQEHELGWFIRKLVAARKAKEDNIVGTSLRQVEPEPLQLVYARRKLIPLVPVC